MGLFTGLGSALVGGGLSLLGGALNKPRKTSKQAEYTPEQRNILFGDRAVSPEMPQFTAAGLNHLRALQGGYNPATGPSQGPMSFGDFRQALGGLGQPGNPVAGLLGWGGGQMPPLYTNSPFLGANVADPENLQGWPGMEGLMNRQGAQGAGGGAAAPAATGTLVGGGLAMPWMVRTGGGGLLSIDQAEPLVRAGLLNLDNAGAGTLARVRALQSGSE